MSKLKISILDVGHGDFIYVNSPLGNNIVIDCGSGDVVPSTFLKNIHVIDELQISHPHTDHFDDLVDVSKYSIHSFRCPAIDSFSDKTIGWKKYDKEKINKLRELKRTITVNKNAVVGSFNFSYSVFYPTNIDSNNPNTASLVTILSYAGFKMLFGGDLPDSGWANLLRQDGFISAIKGTNIFKVPHHGRKEGYSEELFRYISPKLCIISDKSIDETNKNTVATDWYTHRSTGINIIKSDGTIENRKVLTTRKDNSIFIESNENGNYYIYQDTKWRS